MAKKDPLAFNFGALAKPKKAKRKKKASKGKSGKPRSNAWRQYVGVSNAPIPD